MQGSSDKYHFQELAHKWVQGTISPEEILQYNTWYDQQPDDQLELPEGYAPSPLSIRDRIHAQLLDQVVISKKASVRSVLLWPRVVAAAVVLITLGVWLYFSGRYQDTGIRTRSAQHANDIAPGRNGATLTLANDRLIQLSDAKTGVVIGDDKVAYSDGSFITSPEGTRSLTASTSKGQTYQFTLSDGSKVWLNADSKISFPSAFVGNTRRLFLTGEAYFEIARDKEHPFIVQTGKQEVKVLGTHFNISNYADDSTVETTLLEGSVKVSALPAALRNDRQGGKSMILSPGQQLVLSSNNQIKIAQVNTAGAVAWKNGDFDFDSEKISDILTQLARWYNIDVVYEGKMSEKTFTGKISRSKNLSQVLRMLEKTKGVHFKVEGRRVIVKE